MQDAVIVVGAIVVLAIFTRMLRKFLRKKNSNKLFQSVSCYVCGWRGPVSRYAGRCPQCNEPLGDQKARRRS